MTKEEWYEEMLIEARENELHDMMMEEGYELHERLMAKDYEYALEHSDFADAVDLLESTLKTLSRYGWEMSMKDLLNEI